MEQFVEHKFCACCRTTDAICSQWGVRGRRVKVNVFFRDTLMIGKHPKFHEKTPRERKKRHEKTPGEEKKRHEFPFGPPTLRPPPTLALFPRPTFTLLTLNCPKKIGLAPPKSKAVGKVAKIGLAKVGHGQSSMADRGETTGSKHLH